MDDFNSTNEKLTDKEKLADKERLTNKEVLIKKIKDSLDDEKFMARRLKEIFLAYLDEYYDKEHAPWCIGKPKYENYKLVEGQDCKDYKELNTYYDEKGNFHSANCLTCFEEWCKNQAVEEMPELKNGMIVEIYRLSGVNGYKRHTGVVVDGEVYYQNPENKYDYTINPIEVIKPYIEKIWVLDSEHDFLINDENLIWESYRSKKIKEVQQAKQIKELEKLKVKMDKLK